MSRSQVVKLQTLVDELKEQLRDGQYKELVEGLHGLYRRLPDEDVSGPMYVVLTVKTLSEESAYAITHSKIVEDVLSIIQLQYPTLVNVHINNRAGYTYTLQRCYSNWNEMRQSILHNLFTSGGWVRPLFGTRLMFEDGSDTESDDEEEEPEGRDDFLQE